MTRELLDIARTIAREAGDLAARHRAAGVEVAASKSSIVDIVTEADREAEALIRGRLAELRPNDGFFGEESGAETGSSGLTWLVDPIDGTVNFLYGIPHYAVSIAVVEGDPDPLTWRGLAGAVVNPPAGEVFTAIAGEGAWLGDARLRVAEPVELPQALVNTGFAYGAELRAEQGAVVAGLLPKVRDIRRLGTASLDLCAVAAARTNAYFERNLSPWDHAAGAIIASEAGATVKGWADAAAGRDFILAAHPVVAAALEELLAELHA
ncbi:myo-inositol-1(or 4)-monophosphatase [Microbacteriaceae bacterium SG_E_30_P1]|uniref:Inositol-1-monophosphatase n=1 Tax=Antiquaquibacter oligotrophicus TaxID=2880260 RepID=A0ABT6KSE4_9MICO|nr:inositol monophosphatase family protein [Antiquaquibacter oligotrophicus]MDH6181992.1 myo-inositol-1(or 4)-monophosphatase [Antiquaquibacter oligotrophicus]UDF12339.1 inositol monophosphatase [Antiquaquibacter oligotrophicus]